MEPPGLQVRARHQVFGALRLRIPWTPVVYLLTSMIALEACGLEPAERDSAPDEGEVLGAGLVRMQGAGEAPLSALAPDVVPDAVSDAVPDAMPDAVPDAPHVALPVPVPEEVGALPASAGVAGGAAVYTIPIAVPPGRRGMQPAVALGYASRAGDGVAGVGWSLMVGRAGGSIHRCARTVAQDGQNRGVDFSAADRLCLDGVRLVLVRGRYGAEGSEYRTELDRFARITLREGSMQSVGAVFRVETRDGHIRHYGHYGAFGSSEAVYRPPGAPAPLAWKLRRRDDRQGSSVFYRYGPSDQGHVLREIAFAGTDSTLGDRRVRFDYASRRGNAVEHFRAGVAIRQTLRLRAIRTYVGERLVRRYELEYRESEATGRALLHRVRVCGDEACTAPERTPWTELAYAGAPVTFAAEPLAEAPTEDHHVRLLGDYDGDGTRDLLVFEAPGPEGGAPVARHLHLSSRRGAPARMPIDLTDSPWFEAYDRAYEGYPRTRDTDFDRDGVADLTGRMDGRFAIASWTGEALVPTRSNLSLPAAAVVIETMDADADGDVDVLVRERGVLRLHGNCTAQSSGGAQSSGAARVQERVLIDFCGSDQVTAVADNEAVRRVADLDGNGLPDLLIDWNGTGPRTTARIVRTEHAARGVRFTETTIEALGGPAGSLAEHPGTGLFDADGDGLLDIYRLSASAPPLAIWLNTGRSFQRAAALRGRVSLPLHLFDAAFPMDVDGDGRDELMVPTELVHAWCYMVTERVEPAQYCGADFGLSDAPAWQDRSIYRWQAVGVRANAAGTYWLEHIDTGLQAPVRGTLVEDFFGDGLADVRYRLADRYAETGAGRVRVGWYRSTPRALPARGVFVARNLGATLGATVDSSESPMPDLLQRVRDGLGRVHTWQHAALSSAGVAACPASADQPFYRVDRASAAPHHFHVASSMPVVARFTAPDGVGGQRATCYRYADAMQSDEGRGFQGFRTIVAEQVAAGSESESGSGSGRPTASVAWQLATPTAGDLPASESVSESASGRPTASVAWQLATPTAGDLPASESASESAAGLRTTTHYYDAFPLTGSPRLVQVHLATDPATAPPIREVAMAWAAPCTAGVCRPHLIEQREHTADLATREPLHTTITRITHEPEDLAHGNPSAIEVITDDAFQTRSQRTVLDYDYRDADAWWLDKLVRRTVTYEAVQYKEPPLPSDAANFGDAAAVQLAQPTAKRPTLSAADAGRRQVTEFAWYPDAGPSARLLARITHQPGNYSQEHQTAYAYDAHGNPVRRTITAAGVDTPRITTWTYAPGSYFPATETNAAGHVRSLLHDPATGQVREETRHGITTTYENDGLGRLRTVRRPGAPPVHLRELACDATCPRAAVQRQVTVQDGAPIVRQYLDALGRPIRTELSGFAGTAGIVPDIVVVTEYDARGRLIRQSQPSHDPAGAHFTTYSEHDALGRPGRRTVDRSGHAPAEAVTTYRYEGATTYITRPGGLTESRTMDAAGRLLRSTDAAGHVTHFRHDALGLIALVHSAGLQLAQPTAQQPTESAAGNRITAYHDALGRRLRLRDPDGGTTTFAYNGLGELVSQTNANGDTVSFTYDALGRLRERLVNGEPDAAWTYDQSRPGVLDAELGMDGFARRYTYDDLLRPVRVTTDIPRGLSFVHAYAYDRYYGRVKAMRTPDGEQVAFRYDAHGYPLGEHDARHPAQSYRTIEVLTPRGQLARERFGNGLVGTYDHVAATGLLTRIRVAPPTGPPVQDQAYAYDDAHGNLTRREDRRTGEAETFTYDALQRLVSFTRIGTRTGTQTGTRTGSGAEGSATTEYAYAPLGNLTRQRELPADGPAQTIHYTPGDARRANDANAGPHALQSLTHSDGRTTSDFTYDDSGNLIAGSGRTIHYDALGRAVAIEQAGATTRFAYAPDGSRYKQEHAGQVTYYAGEDFEYTVHADRTITKRTYVADYLVIENRRGQRRLRYLHPDRQGSIATITDQAGHAIEHRAYAPFGQPRDPGGSGRPPRELGTTPRGFTGHEHLTAHGLIHMGGRLYDPALARFLSVDPLIQNPAHSQSLNPYSYVRNNPLGAVDPTGYGCEPIGDDSMRCVDSDGNVIIQPIPVITANGRQGQGMDPRQTGPAVETNILEKVAIGVAKGAAAVAGFAWDVARGFASGGVDTAAGLYHVIAHPMATGQSLAYAARHPIVTGRALWSSAKTSIDTSVRAILAGDPHAIGRAGFEATALVFGAGVTRIPGLAKATRLADDVADAGRSIPGGQIPSKPRFIADDAGSMVDTHATPPGRYIQPDRSATDILQEAGHPALAPFLSRTHTHQATIHRNPVDPSRATTRLSKHPRPVTAEEVLNIMFGRARMSRPRGR